MGFLDELREALRRPPGLDDADGAVPEALVERCRQIVYDELCAGPDGPALGLEHQRWSRPAELRARIRAAWRAASEGLFGGASEDQRLRLVEEAVRHHIRSRVEWDLPVFRPGTLDEHEIQRLASLLSSESVTGALWRDPPRYLVELGALDPTGTRRTRLGDLLLQLGVRESVLALLHAEASQSSGVGDDFRLPRWVFGALARGHDLTDDHDDPWPSLDRLVALGLLYSDRYGDLQYLSDRSSWLADAADERSPLAILVRSTLDDSASSSGGAEPRASSQQAVREIAELVAHELGNSLAPLALLVTQLGRELSPRHRHVVRLEAITARLQQFASSLDQILPTDEAMTAVALLDVLQDALARTASERNGHVTVSLSVTDTDLRGRRSRLRLAFENLIRNAAQAAHAVEHQVTLWIRGGAGPQGVEVAFEDDGPGVPQPLVDTLFERGVSGRGTSGLGLALVREIATEHRGRVRHEHREGGGARFVLTLPGSE